jgi:hypothetical protein
MNRRERRIEIRRLKKEINALQSDPTYLTLLQDEELGKIIKDNLVFLEKGEYIDRDIQLKYGKAINFLQTLNQLRYQLNELQK